MKALRRLWILALIAAIASPAAQAQVRASLVSAERSIQPSRPLTVALRLEHEPHWHSYWLNAGTGYPTRLEWHLPTGWNAGEIQWPVPMLIKDAHGNVTGNGYEGTLYLPVILTPPADAKQGTRAVLKATAKWLMCADVCIPGSAEVSLSLPVSATAAMPDEGLRAKMTMQLPQEALGWTLAVGRADKSFTLRVDAPAAINSPHFFAEEEFIQYDKPQLVTGDPKQLTLMLPLADDTKAVPEKLVGILAYTDSKGVYRGVRVNAPFSSLSAASSVAGVAVSGAARLAAGGPGSGGGLSAGVLMFALLGGLILNLMPCVFPVLGIKIMGFINQAGNDRRKVARHGVMFTVGVLLSFWGLAGLLAVLRAGGEQLGWGFQLQSAPFVFGLAVVMLIFALSLSGVFEFGMRATGVGGALHSKEGYGGSFFAGVLATVVATPCSAPFLAPALGAALALPAAQSFIVFTAIGLGLSAPYLLLSAFPRAVSLLPRPGQWMNTFKQVMAFPLYATVGYLIWVLAGQTSENGLLAALFGLTVIAMAVWFYGHFNVPGAGRGRVRLATAGALALLLLGLNWGWPRAAKATDIVWEPWSAERVAQLREEGRSIYVDFTARWCATCQANKKLVFGSEEVKRYVRDHHVALLKADWTNSDPHITAELARWHRSAVPFNLVYVPPASEPIVLPQLLTPATVLDSFRRAPLPNPATGSTLHFYVFKESSLYLC
jgi:thiol:disulfide interchange protein/DsbC/DsbD-like thiol-disulfide interchange protein